MKKLEMYKEWVLASIQADLRAAGFSVTFIERSQADCLVYKDTDSAFAIAFNSFNKREEGYQNKNPPIAKAFGVDFKLFDVGIDVEKEEVWMQEELLQQLGDRVALLKVKTYSLAYTWTKF